MADLVKQMSAAKETTPEAIVLGLVEEASRSDPVGDRYNECAADRRVQRCGAAGAVDDP